MIPKFTLSLFFIIISFVSVTITALYGSYEKKELILPNQTVIYADVDKTVKKESKISKKDINKMVKRMTPKFIPRMKEQVFPIITKKMIITSSNKIMIKNDYLLKLREKIENNKIYPTKAKKLKQQGNVIVSFEITKSGYIKKVSLKDACPYSRLNSAAIKLLKDISRFEPIPKELEKNTWAIEVPISYSIINI